MISETVDITFTVTIGTVVKVFDSHEKAVEYIKKEFKLHKDILYQKTSTYRVKGFSHI